MRKLNFVFVFILAGLSAFGQCNDYAKTITVDELKEHLYVLSSDAFEGRETSKAGQKKAAAWLEDYYVSLGLQAGQNNGVSQQSFLLRKRKLVATHLNVGTLVFESSKDLFCLDADGLEGITTFSSISFLGYGITEGSYNDYEGLDVKGGAVVVYDGEPVDKHKKSIFAKGSDLLSDWSFDPALKINAAQQAGARAIFVIRSDYSTFLPRVKYWLESDRMELLEDVKDQKATGIPMVFISEETARKIFPNLPSKNQLNKKKSKKKNKCVSREKAVLNIEVQDEVVSSENVLAFIEGSDPDLKNEVVIVSAHYDHIGIVNGEINNGADDDGSGTVSAMEIAEAFITAKKEGHGAKRSVLVLHVSGEEKGLFGSDYYTRYPVYPLESTVCDLNIDMIGRVDEEHKSDENYVYLIGSNRLSNELHDLSEKVNNENYGIKLDYTYNADDDPNQFYYRSDHYNFAKHNIPVIFYFSGVHEDYHRPGDDPEKIRYEKMCRIAQLVFCTAWEVANKPTRIQLNN